MRKLLGYAAFSKGWSGVVSAAKLCFWLSVAMLSHHPAANGNSTEAAKATGGDPTKRGHQQLGDDVLERDLWLP